jgi:DMSO reductase anchor subunit
MQQISLTNWYRTILWTGWVTTSLSWRSITDFQAWLGTSSKEVIICTLYCENSKSSEATIVQNDIQEKNKVKGFIFLISRRMFCWVINIFLKICIAITEITKKLTTLNLSLTNHWINESFSFILIIEQKINLKKI